MSHSNQNSKSADYYFHQISVQCGYNVIVYVDVHSTWKGVARPLINVGTNSVPLELKL